MVISFISVYGIFYDAKVRINNVETKYFKEKQPFGLIFKFERQNNPPYGVSCVQGGREEVWLPGVIKLYLFYAHRSMLKPVAVPRLYRRLRALSDE